VGLGIEQLRTLDEVAGSLRVSPRTVRREVKRGRLAKPVKIGGAVRWPQSDVEAYMERLKEERGS
jgi:excisionase family DNA binding protein